jgi:transient receptor potential cation channel subfamily M protein 3
VILGLLCPFYIAKLEFKSKGELQFMPQTEEEHMINLMEEKKSKEGQPTNIHCNVDADAEVSLQSRCRENKNCSQHQTLS